MRAKFSRKPNTEKGERPLFETLLGERFKFVTIEATAGDFRSGLLTAWVNGMVVPRLVPGGSILIVLAT